MNQPVKLVSLNIEGSKHFDRVIPFFKKENPDVLCVQELFKKDFKKIENAIKAKGKFVEMLLREERGRMEVEGMGIFARRIKQPEVSFYWKNHPIKRLDMDDMDTVQKALLTAVITKSNIKYRIGTTHFTWSPDGQPTDKQRCDLESLYKALNKYPDIVFCGDFNAPRGREIFDSIASKYKDNIPKKYKTSLDEKFHRAGALPFVVDGLFSTPHYKCMGTKLVGGVSDHLAIVSKIIKIN